LEIKGRPQEYDGKTIPGERKESTGRTKSKVSLGFNGGGGGTGGKNVSHNEVDGARITPASTDMVSVALQ